MGYESATAGKFLIWAFGIAGEMLTTEGSVNLDFLSSIIVWLPV